ncbi:hypothetical protein CDA63_03715 [Hymenobacter amundsenii]|uniref:Uncharacterized protein n=1 Tax=Hymenobacter amundsenii TaxID=2006685 RepID=A0A246FP30_9BACT|nr:hypothetical protein CDA63_03715 [Hymenobacter amundsenii]
MLLTACGPTRVLSVLPAGWGGGRAVSLVSHPNSVYVRFQFVRAEAEELVFQAEFSNAADYPVTVDPANFYYLPLPDSAMPSASVVPAFAPGPRPARDPEAHLAALAARRDQEAVKADKVSFFELLTLATNIAEDISSIKKKETAAQVAERDARHQNDGIYFDNQRADHADAAYALHATVTEQAHALLRPATLQPGDQVVGLVYFPRLDAARQLRFVLFFDERPVQFDFSQELRKIKLN